MSDINGSHTLAELIVIHSRENLTLLVRTHCGEILRFHRQGVADLYELYTAHPEQLEDAIVIDKVVGKGAAALMLLGKVKSVYAGVISEPALALMETANVQVEYKELVPHIRNRSGQGYCPVETVCSEATNAEECLPRIRHFLESAHIV